MNHGEIVIVDELFNNILVIEDIRGHIMWHVTSYVDPMWQTILLCRVHIMI
jgi:hypothetical protein